MKVAVSVQYRKVRGFFEFLYDWEFFMIRNFVIRNFVRYEFSALGTLLLGNFVT
jgi:hypothetical protein